MNSVANFHSHVSIISRSDGRCAVACAAYRSGTRLRDERTDRVADYRAKRGIEHAEIILPASAPERFLNRELLWNSVEHAERRKDAQLAREIEFSLPRELSRDEQLELTRSYIRENFVRRGMTADFALHDTDGHNPHVHCMLTLRRFDPETGELASKKERAWSDRSLVTEWRQDLEERINTMLERHYGRELEEHERVSAKSFAERDIDREATVHEGPDVTTIERKAQAQAEATGIAYEPVTEVRRQNLEIARRNEERSQTYEVLQTCEREIKRTQERLREYIAVAREAWLAARQTTRVSLDRAYNATEHAIRRLPERIKSWGARLRERLMERRQTVLTARESGQERDAMSPTLSEAQRAAWDTLKAWEREEQRVEVDDDAAARAYDAESRFHELAGELNDRELMQLAELHNRTSNWHDEYGHRDVPRPINDEVDNRVGIDWRQLAYELDQRHEQGEEEHLPQYPTVEFAREINTEYEMQRPDLGFER